MATRKPIEQPPPAVEAKGQSAPSPPVELPPHVCASCVHWDRPQGLFMDADGAIGICRRNHPVPLMAFNAVQRIGPITTAPAVWPTTYAGESCGEGAWRDA